MLFNSCQFVVKYSGDYSVHLADPDLLVEWDMIEQVVSFIDALCVLCLNFYFTNRGFFVTRFHHVQFVCIPQLSVSYLTTHTHIIQYTLFSSQNNSVWTHVLLVVCATLSVVE